MSLLECKNLLFLLKIVLLTLLNIIIKLTDKWILKRLL